MGKRGQEKTEKKKKTTIGRPKKGKRQASYGEEPKDGRLGKLEFLRELRARESWGLAGCRKKREDRMKKKEETC